MSNYRRAWMPDGTCLFTANLLERNRRLLVAHFDAQREEFLQTKVARPFDWKSTAGLGGRI